MPDVVLDFGIFQLLQQGVAFAVSLFARYKIVILIAFVFAIFVIQSVVDLLFSFLKAQHPGFVDEAHRVSNIAQPSNMDSLDARLWESRRRGRIK